MLWKNCFRINKIKYGLAHSHCKTVIISVPYYTITLWFPCVDGLIQTRGKVARVEKAREHQPKASDFARFSQLEQLYQVFGSGHPNTETIK